jgi:hypothetical protein
VLLASPQPLDGVWQSRGWGVVYDIQGSSLRAFEVTRSTCVRSFTAERHQSDAVGLKATFRKRDGSRFSIVPDRNYQRVEDPASLSTVIIEQIAELPTVCVPPTANTPMGNFDVFATTFGNTTSLSTYARMTGLHL